MNEAELERIAHHLIHFAANSFGRPSLCYKCCLTRSHLRHFFSSTTRSCSCQTPPTQSGAFSGYSPRDPDAVATTNASAAAAVAPRPRPRMACRVPNEPRLRPRRCCRAAGSSASTTSCFAGGSSAPRMPPTERTFEAPAPRNCLSLLLHEHTTVDFCRGFNYL